MSNGARTYGDVERDMGMQIVENVDGTLQVLSQTSVTSSNISNFCTLHLLRLSATGVSISEYLFDQDRVRIFPYQKMATVSGGYVISASKNSSAGGAYVFQTNTNGNVIWEHDFDPIDTKAVDFAINDMGDIAIGGYYSTGMWMASLDANGGLRWERKVGPGSLNDRMYYVIADGSDFVFASRVYNSAEYYFFDIGEEDAIYFKTDRDGNVEWCRFYEQSDDYQNLRSAVKTNDGGYLFAGQQRITNDEYNLIFRKTDNKGLLDSSTATGIEFNDIWGYTRSVRCTDAPSDIAMNASSVCLPDPLLSWKLDVDFRDNGSIDQSENDNSFRVDDFVIGIQSSRIDFIPSDQCSQTDTAFIRFVVYDDVPPFVICKDTFFVDLTNQNSVEVDAFDFAEFYDTDPCSMPQYAEITSVESQLIEQPTYNVTSADFGCQLVTVEFVDFSFNNAVCTSLLCVDSDHAISGTVFHDVDLECDLDNGENGLPGWIFEMAGLDTFYANSNGAGFFRTATDIDNYVVNVFPPNPYWEPCQNWYVVNVTQGEESIEVPARPVYDCPYMEVDVSTPLLRRCGTSTYTARYCNSGTVEAENVLVEVALDDDFEFISTTHPIYTQAGSNVLFLVGTVQPSECGFINFDVKLSCDVPLGATHCVEAHITPDSLCLPYNADWSGAEVALEAECEGDSARFMIKNIGTGNMNAPKNYIIIQDAVGYSNGSFELNSGERKEVATQANGATIRMEAEQESFFPGLSMPSITVERCSDGNGTVSLGFYNQMPLNDADHFISIDCQENRGSYDPNDKLGYPKGVTSNGYIKPNTEIEYRIRFQNTGNLAADKVVIIDTLPTVLNPSTIRLGTSSHPYTFNLDGGGILTFTFNDINLPDSSSNEAQSHGFVKFKIAQFSDLAPGTLIINDASIYFDNNPPILTQIYQHEVNIDFLSSTPSINWPTIRVLVAPNPFDEYIAVECADCSFEDATIHLYNVWGQRVKVHRLDSKVSGIEMKGLSAGMYQFEIRENNRRRATGKIIKK